MSDEGFLARWSRRKVGRVEPKERTTPGVTAPTGAASPTPAAVVTQVGPEPTPGASAPAPVASTSAPAVSAPAPAADPKAPEEAIPMPTMADVAALTRSSDYSRFVAPGVDRTVSNAAMKKLFFGDPHFNVMDGLDTYIDDYGRADPIPPAMLRAMNQAASLGLFDESAMPPAPTLPAEADAPAQAGPDGLPRPAVAQSATDEPEVAPAERTENSVHADPDLRLQQDDAARRPGAGQGARD